MRNQYHIIVNDEYLDLSDNTVIAVSLQSFVIGEFTSRFTNYTNRISVPRTDNNNRIFGNAHNINSSSRVQYAANNVRLLVNGIEIINGGYIIINEVTDVYKITIYSGLLGFSATIGEKMLYELTESDVTASVQTPTINDSIDETYHNANLPTYLYSDLIETILEEGGYSYSGSVFSANDYARMILYYSRPTFEYNEQFGLSKEFRASIGTPQVLTPNAPTTYKILAFDATQYNGSQGFYDGADRWTIQEDAWFDVTVYCNLQVTVSGGTGNVRLSILKDGVEATTTGPWASPKKDVATGSTNTRVSLICFHQHQPAPLDPATYFEIGYSHTTGSGATLTVTSAVWYVTVHLSPRGTANTTNWDYRYLLPDYSQLDLLTEFMLRFGLVPVEVNKHVTFKNIQEILLDKSNAVDWTDKRVNKENTSIVFTTDKYGQSNEFKYSNNDDLALEGQGDYSIAIDNPNLPTKKTIISSLFNNTLTALIEYSTGNGINMAHVPIYDGSTFTEEPGLRLLMQRDRYTNEDGTGKVAYFIEPRESYQMSWEYFVTTYYQLLFDSLADVKTVQHQYLLTEADIASFDPSLLIYDDGNYYSFPTIKNYVAGQITTVEMLKI